MATLEDASPPLWDLAGMEERMAGDRRLVEIICEAFLTDLPAQLEKLKNFLENSDSAGSERQAHTIKGASANVGGERLRAVAEEMEKFAKAGKLGASASLFPTLEGEFAALVEIIENRNNRRD